METAKIRKLIASEYSDAITLYKELVGDIPVLDGEEGRKRFAEILQHPGTSVFGAEVGGKIVSIATLHVMPNLTFGGRSNSIVENVVTMRAHRGTGLGRKVMEALMEEAWSQGAYKIMLLTGKSLGAKGFYEKLGFTEDDKYGMTIRRAPQRGPRD